MLLAQLSPADQALGGWGPLLAQVDPAGFATLGPWAQGGATAVLAALVWWLITKTLPKMNEASDARTLAFLKNMDDQRATTHAAFRALTDDYRDEMRLERDAHMKEHSELRADLRALGDEMRQQGNGHVAGMRGDRGSRG